MSAVPEIRMVTLVRAPRDRAYDALTRAEELDAWFTTGAEVDPRPGGEIVWRWVGWGPDRFTGEDRGPVLEARRPERYVFRWQAGLGGTTVEIDFDEHPDGLDGLGRGADAAQVLRRARRPLLTHGGSGPRIVEPRGGSRRAPGIGAHG